MLKATERVDVPLSELAQIGRQDLIGIWRMKEAVLPMHRARQLPNV